MTIQQALLKQIKERIKVLNEKEEYDLGNAYDDLNSLIDYYNDDETINKQQSFTNWHRLERNKQLQGIGVTSDVTYWVGSIDNLWNTDISDDDFTLFNNYFNSVLDSLK